MVLRGALSRERSAALKILFLSSEIAPWSKTGGLADVAGALPRALAARGHTVHVVSPLYACVPRDGLSVDGPGLELTFPFGTRRARFHSVQMAPRCRATFVENALFFDRPGLYVEKDEPYPDNAQRFAFFTVAALTFAQQQRFEPDLVHLNDWQTGLGALALKTGYGATTPSLLTIHNLAYQGLFAKSTVAELGIPWSLFTLEGVEYWHELSFLKAGIQYASAVNTVSPTYAREIQTPALGMGFDGIIRARVASSSMFGILNGIDTAEWNPATDVLLPARYSWADLTGRGVCQNALYERARLDPPARGMPLFGIIGRMVEQKGVDLLQAALPPFLEHGARAVVLGSGSTAFERGWRELATRFPRRLSVTVGFDNALAHLIEASSDFFLMPSRFEPCGLNQMYSLAYGAVPIVHAVGGLKDTVVDLSQVNGTGIQFHQPTVDALRGALTRAVELMRDKTRYARVQQQGMRLDFSWSRAAGEYEQVYESITKAGLAF